jgi:hypothetical protein
MLIQAFSKSLKSTSTSTFETCTVLIQAFSPKSLKATSTSTFENRTVLIQAFSKSLKSTSTSTFETRYKSFLPRPNISKLL